LIGEKAMRVLDQATARPTPQWELGQGQRLFLDGVRWSFYEACLAEFADRPSIRFTYDRGKLEVMSPSPEHEAFAQILGRIFEALARETRLAYKCLRSVTCRREDLTRGLEPDNCFYTRHVRAVLGLRRLDLSRDPPPDVAIEIDITHSPVDRQSIYAALGVPEIWVFNGQVLQVYRLRGEGDYELVDRSPTFPFFDAADIVPLVHDSFEMDDLAFEDILRQWAKQRVSGSSKGGASST